MARKKVFHNIGLSSILSRFLKWAEQAPQGATDYAAHSLIYLMRVRLGMTQAQLARRAGLPQSHIANIERGKTDVRLSTLRRIFNAMHCRLVLSPQPVDSIDAMLRSRAAAVAKRRVARVAGTMALEEQSPDRDLMSELEAAEISKLMQNPSSQLWEDE